MMELLDLRRQSACEEYELFIQSRPNGSFLQCLDWAGVKPGWSREVVVSRRSDGSIRGAMQVLIRKLPIRWSLLYAPRGPVGDCTDEAMLRDLMEGVHLLAHLHHGYRFVCDPLVLEQDTAAVKTLERVGLSWRPNQKDLSTMQSRINYMLPLAGKNREQLLTGFSKKCRYNLRLAQKNGVVCRIGTLGDLDGFYRLMQVTGERDNFTIRPKQYFHDMLTQLGEHCRMYVCEYEGELISGAIAVQYASITSYVYGASDNRFRQVMPNYLMQWEMILWALDSGCTVYDFQAIPFYQDTQSPYYGIYRFKHGFGGVVVSLAGDFNYYYCRPVHWAAQLGRKLFVKKQSAMRHIHSALRTRWGQKPVPALEAQALCSSQTS